MKKLFILAIICLLFGSVDAQVRLGVNINIGSQPAWGPSGYDYVDYYYLPDYDVFYYVPTHRFICWVGGRWIFRASLPARYGHIDLYSVHKVVINEDRPYLRHEFYRDRYRNFIGMHDQRPIRGFHESRRNFDRNHDGHISRSNGNRHEDHGRGKGNGNQNDRGNNHDRPQHGDHK